MRAKRTRGRHAAAAQTWAPAAPKLAACGPSPWRWGAVARRRLSLSKLWSRPPFGVTRRRSSMFYAEDGDLAHEFYEETVVTKNGQKRAKRRWAHENLIPQGIGSWIPPRIHVDFLYEV
ncbi:hypothetical protein J1605_007612 [Eschrichtius robustus]|uniref:Tumor suppressor candidate 2 n=1 Tax=Eschrichtius robustus TaxID=9764 RepID=A0AB34H034_ESCRO|nr:hypothetical protein J1605_007612 [Eschrichtius robustus]